MSYFPLCPLYLLDTSYLQAVPTGILDWLLTGTNTPYKNNKNDGIYTQELPACTTICIHVLTTIRCLGTH